MSIYNLFKSCAFRLDPELVHNLTMKGMGSWPRVLAGFFSQENVSPKYALEVAGLRWRFPVGLAAGLDKNALALPFFNQLYFGAIEVGTVTPKAQEGNPKPRLFRFEAEESLLNRMGFNNLGMDQVFENLHQLKPDQRPQVLGVNLGKNKTTAAALAAQDYCLLYERFAEIADYMVVNVSSPNTPGLRDLQEESALSEIFDGLADVRQKRNLPLFLKVSPDLPEKGLDACVQIAKKYNLAGLIATNTTIVPERGQGGVSGKLLRHKSAQVRQYLLKQLRETPRIELIGVGGISSFDDVWDFWRQGGRAVQVYSAFIFQGPKLLSDMAVGIDSALCKTGAKDVMELLSCPHDLPETWRL